MNLRNGKFSGRTYTLIWIRKPRFNCRIRLLRSFPAPSLFIPIPSFLVTDPSGITRTCDLVCFCAVGREIEIMAAARPSRETRRGWIGTTRRDGLTSSPAGREGSRGQADADGINMRDTASLQPSLSVYACVSLPPRFQPSVPCCSRHRCHYRRSL